MPKKVSDGSEHAAHVLFDKLVLCERHGSVFHVGGRSKNYERSGTMTEEYTRQLHAQLGLLLAELDEERGVTQPAIDDITLVVTGDSLRFELFLAGKRVGAGSVTRAVAEKAKAFLNGNLGPKNVFPFRRPDTGMAALVALEIMPRLMGWT